MVLIIVDALQEKKHKFVLSILDTRGTKGYIHVPALYITPYSIGTCRFYSSGTIIPP